MDVKIYKRDNSKFWWMKYYLNGKLKRESTKTTQKRKAQEIGRNKEKILMRNLGIEDVEEITLKDLVEEVESDYRLNNKKSIDKVIHRKKPLFRILGKDIKAVNITEKEIEEYKKKRYGENKKPATINRELALLRRGFNLLHQQRRIGKVPLTKNLQENNVRTGYFEHWQYVKLLQHLPDYLKPVAKFAYKSGWRKEEILNLEWSMVDLSTGLITIPPGDYTKNKKGREYYLDEELWAMFRELWNDRLNSIEQDKEWGEKAVASVTYVFLNRDEEDKIRDFYGAWRKGCKDAGIGKMKFHDFRRTAVRNLIRCRTPQRVAMEITGHLTSSVFQRYNIVSNQDIKDALIKQSEYLENQPTEEPITKPPDGYVYTEEELKVMEERRENRKKMERQMAEYKRKGMSVADVLREIKSKQESEEDEIE